MDVQSSGGRWGTVAAAVMRRPGLSVAAKAVYSDMATYADRHGWVWVRQETIASDLERSRTWVHAAIVELEAQGLLQHERQFLEGRQRSSRYRLLDGMTRGATPSAGRSVDADRQVSEDHDSAVQPADTRQQEGFHDSLSANAGGREPGDRSEQVRDVPSDWVPSPEDVSWARARHPSLNILAFTENFILSCRAKVYRYADISAAWRRWLTEPKGKLPLLPAKSDPAFTEDHRHVRSHAHRQQQHRPASAPGGAGGLSAADRDKATRVLERLTARRASHQPAGPAS